MPGKKDYTGVIGYPHPKYLELIKAESSVKEKSVSKIVSDALKLYYDQMSPQERISLLNAAARTGSKNSY